MRITDTWLKPEAATTKQKTKKKNIKRKKIPKEEDQETSAEDTSPEHHRQSIIDVSINKELNHLLLSASADSTINLWDLNEPNMPKSTFRFHKDKVSICQWSLEAPYTTFLSAGYDKQIFLIDANENKKLRKWKVEADIEALKWDKHNSNQFLVIYI